MIYFIKQHKHKILNYLTVYVVPPYKPRNILINSKISAILFG